MLFANKSGKKWKISKFQDVGGYSETEKRTAESTVWTGKKLKSTYMSTTKRQLVLTDSWGTQFPLKRMSHSIVSVHFGLCSVKVMDAGTFQTSRAFSTDRIFNRNGTISKRSIRSP